MKPKFHRIFFRAVVHDAKLDPSLEIAAVTAGISDLHLRLPRSIMWINPGEVAMSPPLPPSLHHTTPPPTLFFSAHTLIVSDFIR